MNNLKDTGERLMPVSLGKTAVEHLHRYALSSELVRGKKVLDIASGEGYGSNLLAEYAEQVTGVDISEEAILHAQNVYKKENLCFKQGSVLNIPFENELFDAVISYETLEHISDHQKMISELKRVLKPDGILIISTPEKSVYSDQSNYSNPFHEKELYEEEFKDLIYRDFEFCQIFFQKYVKGSLMISSHGKGKAVEFYTGDFSQFNLKEKFNQEYMVAICSNSTLPQTPADSFFSNGVNEKILIEEIVKEKIKKIKSGFRYRLIDFLFKPWDMFKVKLK